jgi:hypothetical protein
MLRRLVVIVATTLAANAANGDTDSYFCKIDEMKSNVTCVDLEQSQSPPVFEFALQVNTGFLQSILAPIPIDNLPLRDIEPFRVELENFRDSLDGMLMKAEKLRRQSRIEHSLYSQIIRTYDFGQSVYQKQRPALKPKWKQDYSCRHDEDHPAVVCIDQSTDEKAFYCPMAVKRDLLNFVLTKNDEYLSHRKKINRDSEPLREEIEAFRTQMDFVVKKAGELLNSLAIEQGLYSKIELIRNNSYTLYREAVKLCCEQPWPTPWPSLVKSEGRSYSQAGVGPMSIPTEQNLKSGPLKYQSLKCVAPVLSPLDLYRRNFSAIVSSVANTGSTA